MYLRENRGSLKDLIAAVPLKPFFFFIHCLLPFSSSQEETRD
jgi:hypothetical protein